MRNKLLKLKAFPCLSFKALELLWSLINFSKFFPWLYCWKIKETNILKMLPYYVVKSSNETLKLFKASRTANFIFQKLKQPFHWKHNFTLQVSLSIPSQRIPDVIRINLLTDSTNFQWLECHVFPSEAGKSLVPNWCQQLLNIRMRYEL